jgi:gliding motility-associated-like protein
MKLRQTLWALLLLCAGLLHGQEAIFVPNEGQWDGEFQYKLPLKYGALFFEPGSVQMVLRDAGQIEDLRGHQMHEAGLSLPVDPLRTHAVRMSFIDAEPAESRGAHETGYYHNYFLGEDQSRWKGGVRPHDALVYEDLYPSTKLKFFAKDSHLKYDWQLRDPKVLSQIKWTYEGATGIQLNPEGSLQIQTSVGEFMESTPVAWGWKNGERVHFDCWYTLVGQEIGFAAEDEAMALDSLVIDPQLIFTSFSGSLTDNWGFSATYDDAGRLYGAGVAFATGYVASIGAFQTTYNDPPGPNIGYYPDVTITVFEPQGSTMLYATYLGGTAPDQPHSMVVNSNDQLIVMGTTGSSNFPTQNPVQSSNAGGNDVTINGYEFKKSDLFVTRFNTSGTAVLSSTYLGGTGNDGLNTAIIENYGDAARGEVVVDASNNIYVTASTNSSNFPSTNCTRCSNAGGQDAVVLKLNASGTSLLWSNYYGSTSDDAGYSLKYHNGAVFITGGTEGGNLPSTSGGFKSSYGGNKDGYVAKFNAATGALLQSTYVGTSQYDQSFILDVDKLGNVYAFGQTLGNYPITAGAWGTPQYRKQFIHKISNDLTSSQASTAFGSPFGSLNLVPTAFNVDECLNILLSGWGGVTNNGYFPTTVEQLPVSADALQSSTNGSDFYFMVLTKNFSSFKYGSYFGGSTSAEHVDGGTSRFDERGRIYQAVCAGCGGNDDLPTTPGAFSETNNSSNCNLGVIKLDFETGIEANWSTDSGYNVLFNGVLPDTSCETLTLQFIGDSSINANAYYWDFGQGITSTSNNPITSFQSLGTYNVMFVAIDTVCDRYDTVYFDIIHDSADFPTSNWFPNYSSCDLFKEVEWKNNRIDADYFIWDFGDGTSLTTVDSIVTHNYPSFATYTATVTARDSFCSAEFQQSFNITFDDDVEVPSVDVYPDSCRYGGVDVVYTNIDSTMLFYWNFSGNMDTGMIPNFRYPESGTENIVLTIIDTNCNRDYTFDFTTDVTRIDGRVFIPSTFTPNGDGKNDSFKIFGNSCLENPTFIILDSWGNEIFRSEDPFHEFWDGTFKGNPVPQDVYTYRFTGGKEVRMGTVTIIN